MRVKRHDDAPPRPPGQKEYFPGLLDQINRPTATCNFGTTIPSRSQRPIAPSTPSDTELVATTAFNVRGETSQATDPAGVVFQQTFDEAGRLKTQVNNVVGGGTQFDQNQTVEYTYNPDGRIATLQADNPSSGGGTGNQVTHLYIRGDALRFGNRQPRSAAAGAVLGKKLGRSGPIRVQSSA